MKFLFLSALMLSSLPAFSAQETLIKNCTASFTTKSENIYNNSVDSLNSTIEVKIFQKGRNFRAGFYLEENDGVAYQSSSRGETENFKVVSNLVRVDLHKKSTKLNSAERIILQMKDLLETTKIDRTGSNLEGLSLDEVISATVYPIDAFQQSKIAVIDTKDGQGNNLGTIILIDETIKICK